MHPATLPELARVLRPGAEWRIASDDPTYQAWVGEVLAGQALFDAPAPAVARPDGWPPTRYEAKALREGRAPLYWTLRLTLERLAGLDLPIMGNPICGWVTQRRSQAYGCRGCRHAAVPRSCGEDLEFSIEGMNCASCVRRVERALDAVPGVRASSVNLATGRARISQDAAAAGAIAEAVHQAGYTIATSTVDLAISGMTCASCAQRVERALLGVPGVVSAEVNLATERARVTSLGAEIPAVALADAVSRAGYAARR